jgi:hypothetical protein
VAILGSEHAPVVDRHSALRVPNFGKEVVRWNSSHTGPRCPAAKKADSFGCAPRAASKRRKKTELSRQNQTIIIDYMSGVLESYYGAMQQFASGSIGISDIQGSAQEMLGQLHNCQKEMNKDPQAARWNGYQQTLQQFVNPVQTLAGQSLPVFNKPLPVN